MTTSSSWGLNWSGYIQSAESAILFVTAAFITNSITDFLMIQEIAAVFIISHIYVNCTLHANFLFWDISINSSKYNILVINVRFKWATNCKCSFTKSDLRTNDTTSTKVSEHHSTNLPRFLIIKCSMWGINMKNRNEKDCNPNKHGTETGKQIKESIDTIS